ncbi:hemerythrin domain-containing protein [Nakamurella endophytica]|uniref:Hemerythrin n=1 Tax=Nakamurella endophytica TaxID=1748367 RepID=A0A917WCK2_9ACTN|nr:hemerythrin domain-containing protein [Nakamurella endophytica]GGL93061.1 hemerythrin [Nakamurella endophytica]
MDAGTGTTKLVPLLLEQHALIRALLQSVGVDSGCGRQQAFADLCRLLAVHEAAEEEAVHPTARHVVGDTVEQRIAEESHAAQAITDLESIDVGSAEFDRRFAELRDAVERHAAQEEDQEFPHLAAVDDVTVLTRLEAVLRVAARWATTESDMDFAPFTEQLAHYRQRFRQLVDPHGAG